MEPHILCYPNLNLDLQHANTQLTTMAGRENWHHVSGGSSASTPNSAESFPELLSPSHTNLPTRKRSHSKHLDGGLAPHDDNISKSRRTSPSPFMSPFVTSPATPAGASSGYGYPTIGDGFFNLTFVNIFTFPSLDLSHHLR
jgi:hypothetical protein